MHGREIQVNGPIFQTQDDSAPRFQSATDRHNPTVCRSLANWQWEATLCLTLFFPMFLISDSGGGWYASQTFPFCQLAMFELLKDVFRT